MKICLCRLPAALDSHNYAKSPLESDEESSSEYITESDTETTDGKSVSSSSSSSSGSSSSNSSSTETDSESSAEDKAEEGESDVVEGENSGSVSNQLQGIVEIIWLTYVDVDLSPLFLNRCGRTFKILDSSQTWNLNRIYQSIHSSNCANFMKKGGFC